jgi:hypothetical protein
MKKTSILKKIVLGFFLLLIALTGGFVKKDSRIAFFIGMPVILIFTGYFIYATIVEYGKEIHGLQIIGPILIVILSLGSVVTAFKQTFKC